jgi:protein disulfide-isomerase
VISSSDSKKTTKKKSHPFWQVFWLTFLVGSLVYAWYSYYVPSNDVAWAENIEEAQKLARESNKDMLLFFTGDWCVPCRIMKREVFADDEVMKAINSQVVPIIIDVDDPNVKDLVERYQAGVTPITLFTDQNGEVLDYAVGKIGKTKFLEMLEKISAVGP